MCWGWVKDKEMIPGPGRAVLSGLECPVSVLLLGAGRIGTEQGQIWACAPVLVPGLALGVTLGVPRRALQAPLLLHPKIHGFLHPWLSNLSSLMFLGLFTPVLPYSILNPFLIYLQAFFSCSCMDDLRPANNFFSQSMQVSSPINKNHISHQWTPWDLCNNSSPV